MLARYRADPAALMADAGFAPDPWQAALLRDDARRTLILCARQVGKSLTVGFLALHAVLARPRVTVVVLAPVEQQANELLRKVVSAFYAVGAPVAVRREGVTYFELATGSRVLALPGKERSVHGYTADLLIVDEAARVPDEVFHAASPQLSASGGRFVALSTAFAKSGFFYREWTEGQGYRRVSVTARECPRHTPAFLAGERRAMGEWWYRMSYLNEFGDDVAAVFRGDDIRAAVTADVAPLFRVPAPPPDEPPDVGLTTGAVDASVGRLFG